MGFTVVLVTWGKRLEPMYHIVIGNQGLHIVQLAELKKKYPTAN